MPLKPPTGPEAALSSASGSPGKHPGIAAYCRRAGIMGFAGVGLAGVVYMALNILRDAHAVNESLANGAFLFLGMALLVALGFEFVNGFHDTANAVATVIYTRSLPPVVAVVWSGIFNFLGVLTSTGAVAYGIVTLLPVELILQVGSGAGYAMIFALLISALVWNLGTWAIGIPNSSSHTLIGSIMGVGLANGLLEKGMAGGVDWSQALKIGQALVFSPLIGFVCAGGLVFVLRGLLRRPELFVPANRERAPPWWIRGLLILTCTGVSFAHGGNDGQKGMGLIMLILIGVVPTAYALNRTMPDAVTPVFSTATRAAETVLAAHGEGSTITTSVEARPVLSAALRDRAMTGPDVYRAMQVMAADIDAQVTGYGTLRQVPAAATPNLRNDMYLLDASLARLLSSHEPLSTSEIATLRAAQKGYEAGTRYIPIWVKVAVALALGLGTMVGWKRIVVTVGERIGTQHMSYGQGLAAETVAALTIMAAERFGLPVSTTHILSSGVAGTMMANGGGLQSATLKRIVSAWVLTLPAAMILAGVLYVILRRVMT